MCCSVLDCAMCFSYLPGLYCVHFISLRYKNHPAETLIYVIHHSGCHVCFYCCHSYHCWAINYRFFTHNCTSTQWQHNFDNNKSRLVDSDGLVLGLCKMILILNGYLDRSKHKLKSLKYCWKMVGSNVNFILFADYTILCSCGKNFKQLLNAV